ncbi:MAG: hypothetical protein K8H88_29220 [Sandaracinaceae bacterium]|nr:hypothetical protein [Sandaracinaceae bacterium]
MLRSILALSMLSACGPSELCGNGTLEMGELCDPMIAAGEPGACPEACDDGLAATIDILTGTAESCTRVCAFVSIPSCGTADGFCPPCCDSIRDVDCSPTCGDGVVDTGEVCDGNCPTSCDDEDACTADTLTGSAAMCSAQCHNDAITACTSGDGCCPSTCTPATDADCPSLCGNGVLDTGETCDGNCPASCDDEDACTTDSMGGSASMCNVVCTNTAITTCASGDGCCPSGCDASTDGDCLSPNGAACGAPSQCTGGMCLTGSDWPGGYCTQPCGDPVACPAGGHCVLLSIGPFCLADCEPGTPLVCRTGYVCLNLDADAAFECAYLSPT